MAVRQAGYLMGHVHRLCRSCQIRTVSGRKIIRHGKNSHKRAIAVGGSLIASAQNGNRAFLIAEQRLRHCMPAVEPLSPWGIFSIFKPFQKPLHNIVRMDASGFPYALCQTQSHAAVVRPGPFRLSMCSPTRHPGHRTFPQLFSASEFCRHAQCVSHAYSIDPAAELIPSVRHSLSPLIFSVSLFPKFSAYLHQNPSQMIVALARP